MSSLSSRKQTTTASAFGATRLSRARVLLATLPIALLGACIASGDGDGDDDPEGNPDAQGQGSGICLLNTCNSDSECDGCGDGRTTCLVGENRCVGCDPNTGVGCDAGMTCSSWGICAPDGQTCPVDPDGSPAFSCTQDSDCLACSPMQQLCGPDGKCAACTGANASHCSQADVCVEGQCSAKCPATCATDSDCGTCGGPGNEAHACNEGQCAQCSTTVPCLDGMECQNGTCIPHCGIIGTAPGTCAGSEDCGFCGDGNQAWACKKYVDDELGNCVPAATGCSDFGEGFAMLPPPYDGVTQTCSDDAGCAGISADYNVGELVRDVLGTDSLNVGFADVEIQDAWFNYGMHQCAAMELIGDASCGLCVPCQRDADCEPIGIDPMIGQLFSGDPLAAIAGVVLLDLLFGSSTERQLHFFCQPVAAGYGACVPCGNPLSRCGS